MNAAQAREYTFSRPLKLTPADVKDFWPDLDGQVFLQDLPGDELASTQTMLKDNPVKMMGTLLCKSLVVVDKDTPDAKPEPMYQPTDRDTVAHLGGSVLLPIMKQLSEMLGVDPDAVEALKKS